MCIRDSNIFTQNRLSLDDTVEGGQSLTLGGEYKIIIQSIFDCSNNSEMGYEKSRNDNYWYREWES